MRVYNFGMTFSKDENIRNVIVGYGKIGDGIEYVQTPEEVSKIKFLEIAEFEDLNLAGALGVNLELNSIIPSADKYTVKLVDPSEDERVVINGGCLMVVSANDKDYFCLVPMELVAQEFPLRSEDSVFQSEESIFKYFNGLMTDTNSEMVGAVKNSKMLDFARRFEGAWIKLAEDGHLDWVDKIMEEVIKIPSVTLDVDNGLNGAYNFLYKGGSNGGEVLKERSGGHLANYWTVKNVIDGVEKIINEDELFQDGDLEDVLRLQRGTFDSIFALICEGGISAPPIIEARLVGKLIEIGKRIGALQGEALDVYKFLPQYDKLENWWKEWGVL